LPFFEDENGPGVVGHMGSVFSLLLSVKLCGASVSLW
jgi:hypothetical protein